MSEHAMNAQQRWTAFCWLVRREFWEHRALYLLPLATLLAGLGAFAYWAVSGNASSPKVAFSARLMLGIALYFAVALPALNYACDALLVERRDRSVLFWKSLPASDRTVVLSKVAVLLIALLPVKLAVIFMGDLGILSIQSLVAASADASVQARWSLPPLFVWTVGTALQAILGVMAHAPLYAWLLFVSALVRRAPLLWASAPLLIIPALERIATGDSMSGQWLYRMLLLPRDNAILNLKALGDLQDTGAHLRGLKQSAVEYLADPETWIGLALAAALIAAAAHIRARRGPI